MLSQSTSSGSRRSSSLSVAGNFGLSNVIPLYSRQSTKKRRSAWRIVPQPVPQNLLYRRCLLLSVLLSSTASLVFLSATLTRKWETVTFHYQNVFQELQVNYGPITLINTLINSTNETVFILDYVVFLSGHVMLASDRDFMRRYPMSESHSSKQVGGAFIRLNHAHGTPLGSAYRLIVRRNHQPSDQRKLTILSRFVEELDAVNIPEEPETAWILMNYHAGIWSMHYNNAHVYETHLFHHYYKVCKGPPISGPSLSYFVHNLSETHIPCTQYFLKMQNNIISCVIVVYLCMIVSTIIGPFAVVYRNVPATMVTGVLHVTSGVFVVFANCIHHTKLNRLDNEWGPCHPISRVPEKLRQPQFIDVQSHWPIIVSWTSSPIFFVASIAWIILTHLMTTENSKILI